MQALDTLDPIQRLIILVPPILFAITLHEVAHGWVALRFGDPTAKALGRLSLNPLRHIDPVGTVLVPAMMYFFSGFIFGWAKPVPVSFERLRYPKQDMILVALAGPVANLIMATGWMLVVMLGIFSMTHSVFWIGQPCYYMGLVGIEINVLLGALNLLPIPPLDGSRVLTGLLPDRFGDLMRRIEPFGLLILLLLLFSGVLWNILLPAINLLLQIFHYPIYFVFGY